MKKLKDLIYDYNDIFVTLLIVLIAAAIIFWRVDGIMGYSSYLEAKGTSPEIDIDFTTIDLSPTEEDPTPIEGEDDNPSNPPSEEDPIETVVNPVPDKNFVSTRDIKISIPKGSNSAKIAGIVAAAYGYENDDYKDFVTSFTSVANELKLETSMHYGDFSIASGSSLSDIIKKLAYKN